MCSLYDPRKLYPSGKKKVHHHHLLYIYSICTEYGWLLYTGWLPYEQGRKIDLYLDDAHTLQLLYYFRLRGDTQGNFIILHDVFIM